MPEHTFEVDAYDVDLSMDDDGTTRGLRLTDRGDPGTTAFLNFYPEGRIERRAEIAVAEEGTSLVVDAPLSEFDRFYHLLQTERPVYCYADYEERDGPLDDVESFGLATDLEMVGEGFEDLTG